MKTMPYNLAGSASGTIATSLNTSAMLSRLFDKSALSLATGKKINRSTDNSVLYVKDYRLNESAEELNHIMDGLSTVTARLGAAGSSVSSLISMIDLAKSTAESALNDQNLITGVKSQTYDVNKNKALTDIPNTRAGDKMIVRTGNNTYYESSIMMSAETTLDDLGLNQGDELRVRFGNDAWATLKVNEVSVPVKDFLKQLEDIYGEDRIGVDITDGKLTIRSKTAQPIILAGPEKTEIIGGVPTQVVDFSTADAFGFDTTTTQVITIGDGETFNSLMTALNKASDLMSYIDTDNKLNIASIYGEPLAISDYSGGFAASMGLEDTLRTGGAKTRQSYAANFNDLLDQIDHMVEDCTFNGANMLTGEGVSAIFSDDGSVRRNIPGVKVDTESLGLEYAKNNWMTAEDVQDALTRLIGAKAKLEAAANHFERATDQVVFRSNFLVTLQNSFLKGAESLTAADLNEMSARETAIATQKELINNVINITLDSTKSVLSLF